MRISTTLKLLVVDSEADRAIAENLTRSVPEVLSVVNQLQVNPTGSASPR